MLVLNGNVLKTIYFKLILLSMMIVIIGETFLILHWPGTFLLLITGSVLVISIYSTRFYFKKEKTRLDILKLSWVLTTYTAVLLIVLNYLPKETGFICELLFWALIIDYVVSSGKTKVIKNSN